MRLRNGRSALIFTGVVSVVCLLSSPAYADFNGLPNSARTPGAVSASVTQATIGQTICVAGYTTSVRPPQSYTHALKVAQLASGYTVGGSTATADYEEDHLVPLELGGSPTSPKNLWPQPWAGPLGARQKDALENALHRLVCSGQLPLATAQRVFEENWVAGYRQYILGRSAG